MFHVGDGREQLYLLRHALGHIFILFALRLRQAIFVEHFIGKAKRLFTFHPV